MQFVKIEKEVVGVSERSVEPKPLKRIEAEVVAKAKRRNFTAEYKLRIVREAEGCREEGQIGALLRREGLYSSHLVTWRRQAAEGSRGALSPRRRGPKAKASDAAAKRVADLEKENAKLRERLDEAETIIAFQKKLAEILRPRDGGPASNERRR